MIITPPIALNDLQLIMDVFWVAINRIQNKYIFCFQNIYVCTVYIYVYIKTYTYCIYLENISMYIYLYILLRPSFVVFASVVDIIFECISLRLVCHSYNCTEHIQGFIEILHVW